MKFDVTSLGDHLTDPITHSQLDTQAERFRMWVDLGVHAEKAGFDGFWLGEHHCSDYILSSPQMVLAAVAVQTERIRLGTSISILPNNDPVRLAEDFATLDLLSKGRAEIGFGSGFTKHTFALFGQDHENSVGMSMENLELLETLWNEEEINWSGKFRSPIHESKLQPRTFSGRAIPIKRAVITTIDNAIHAGRAGHKLQIQTAFGVGEKQRTIADAYREAYLSAGHDPAGMSIAIIAYTHVEQDSDAAWANWLPYRAHYQRFIRVLMADKEAGTGVLELISKSEAVSHDKNDNDVCGSPAEVAERILHISDTIGGADRYLGYFDLGGLPREKVFETVDLFAKEVIPLVRRG